MSDGDDGAVERRGAEDDGATIGVADREAIAARIRDHADRVERRERETAIEKLRVRGELTDAQREAVEEMAAGIVDGLLATPEAALQEADDRTLRAAMRVYGLDPDGGD